MGDDGVKNNLLRRLLVPHWVILLAAVGSFVAWALPTDSPTRGYEVRSQLTLAGGAVLLAWYLTAAGVAWAGWRWGRSTRPVRLLDRVDGTTMYRRLTVLATIGVVYTWVVVATKADVWYLLSNSRVNELTEVLPGGAGVQTLRYVVGLSAGIAMARWARARFRPRWDVAYNLVLLVLTAGLSSRLLLILSVVVALFLRVRDADYKGLVLWKVVSLVLVLFLATTALNYTRNAGYYRDHGITNPFEMNVNELVAYVGSPTQVAVGVADAWTDGRADHVLTGDEPAVQLALPTYLAGAEKSDPVDYTGTVDIAENLTTNSVLADVGWRYGVLGLLVVLVFLFAGSVLAGHLTRYRNLLVAGAAVVLYAVAELWRVYLFDAGILHALLLAAVLTALPPFTAVRLVRLGAEGDDGRPRSRARRLLPFAVTRGPAAPAAAGDATDADRGPADEAPEPVASSSR